MRNRRELSKQTAKIAVRVDEHVDEREEQHSVAQVGDGNTPRVAVQGEHASAPVLVVRGLVETDVLIGVNVVHRNSEVFFYRSVGDGKL